MCSSHNDRLSTMFAAMAALQRPPQIVRQNQLARYSSQASTGRAVIIAASGYLRLIRSCASANMSRPSLIRSSAPMGSRSHSSINTASCSYP